MAITARARHRNAAVGEAVAAHCAIDNSIKIADINAQAGYIVPRGKKTIRDPGPG